MADRRSWDAVARKLKASERIAIDVEADGFHRYPERVALIQLAVDDGSIWLVDPLELDDLEELGEVLADEPVPVVAHAASYDVRSMDRDFGMCVRGLFDTAIAAQFCGARLTGLANVTHDVLHVRLAKSKRLQRTDWSVRPLSEEALSYAAGDVRHLLALADRLTERLDQLGRRSWVREECERLERERYRAPEPPESAFMAASGARDLTDRGRAVLRELFVFRESEAQRLGRPPYRVVSEGALVDLASRPQRPLDEIDGLNRRWLGRGRPRLEAALAKGLRAPAIPWRTKPRHEMWPRSAQTRLKQLKSWRTSQAVSLGLDPGIVWPADHLKQVALHPQRPTDALDPGQDVPCVRRWQWSVLGESLERFRRETLGDSQDGN